MDEFVPHALDNLNRDCRNGRLTYRGKPNSTRARLASWNRLVGRLSFRENARGLHDLSAAVGDPLTIHECRKILDEFGSLVSFMSATKEDKLKYIGKQFCDVLESSWKLFDSALIDTIETKSELLNDVVFEKYLRRFFGHEEVEFMSVGFMNSGGQLLDFIHSEGITDSARFDIPTILVHAYDLGATAIFCVHNHPSGDCTPSRADRAVTRDLIEAGLVFRIKILDHFIVSRSQFVSMKRLGMLS